MTTSLRSGATQSSQALSRLVMLLTVALFINYFDRGTLAIAAPLLRDQLHLSNLQIGYLLSAFFWTYTASQIPAGWLGERMDASVLLALGLAIWSIATGLMGLAPGFIALLALRMLLGLGESVIYPCVAKLMATRAPENERGRANGIMTVGTALGTAVGTLVSGLLMAHFGWRPVFVVFGVISACWLLLWRWVRRRDVPPPVTQQQRARPYPLTTLLKQRALWGATLGHFTGSYSSYFVLGWLPLYLVKARGFSLSQMATVATAIYLLQAVAAALSGWFSDRCINRGASSNLVRKATILGGQFGVAIAMAMAAFGGPMVSVAGMFLAGFCFGVQTPMVHTIAQTLAGPRAAGQWMGVQNGLANISGIVGPIITGLVVDATGQFGWAFVIVGVAALLGVVGWGIIIPKVAQVSWPDDPRPAA